MPSHIYINEYTREYVERMTGSKLHFTLFFGSWILTYADVFPYKSQIYMDISVQRMTGSEFYLTADLFGELACECDRSIFPYRL